MAQDSLATHNADRKARAAGWLLVAAAVLAAAWFLSILRFDSPWNALALVADVVAAAALLLGIAAWRSKHRVLAIAAILVSVGLAVTIVLMWFFTASWQ